MSSRVRIHPLLLAIVAATSMACGAEPKAQAYLVEGQILDIRRDAHEVLIKHGDIKGFMPGMTMPFKVKDPALLADKAIGDLVSAQLMVAPEEAWISSLVKTGHAPIDQPAAIPAAAFVTPLAPGDPVPDTGLTDQAGQAISLRSWPDAALVVTFIYVRCPLPQFCPLMDKRFAEIQKGITADPALTGKARLLSISFDPDADTPDALTAHAAKVGARPDIWRFATAPRETVDRLAATFGVNVIREADTTITHNLRTAVIDATGRVVRIHDNAAWTSDDILNDVRQAVAGQRR